MKDLRLTPCGHVSCGFLVFWWFWLLAGFKHLALFLDACCDYTAVKMTESCVIGCSLRKSLEFYCNGSTALVNRQNELLGSVLLAEDGWERIYSRDFSK